MSVDENFFRYVYGRYPKAGAVYYAIRQSLAIVAGLLLDFLIIPVLALIEFVTALAKAYCDSVMGTVAYSRQIVYNITRMWKGEYYGNPSEKKDEEKRCKKN